MTGMIQRRLEKLRQKMKEAGVAAYVIPSSDCHESEYVCGHFRAREYMTGFTGSAGTAVVTLTEAGLWTDGRYFLQAERELLGSGIRLYRMEEPGVSTLEGYVREHLHAGELLGFDGRVLSAFRAEKLRALAKERGAGLLTDRDLVGEIWADRPPLPDAPVSILEGCIAGETAGQKIARVRAQMKECGADVHVLASLCDIAWLLNVRGGDIPCVPVVLSFLCLTADGCCWYVRDSAVTEELEAYVRRCGICRKAYDRIYADLEGLDDGRTVWLDKKKVNSRLSSALPKGVRVLDQDNPTELMKAVKNETELSNLREAHRKEGVAFTRFLYWLKTNAGREGLTELQAEKRLEELRAGQAGYLGPSFETICAYGPHGAIVHYRATKETDVRIAPGNFLLVDAGGHYREGSTDTTRTIVLGDADEGQKRMFTAVLKGNLNLACARFPHGSTGYQLDALCREALWQLGVDYKHGTGHGVGYRLNIHEGPNAFRCRMPKGEVPTALEAGMVTTDEPGIYIEGKYGIRTENELLCVEGEKNEYGQFLEFEILTLAPIDLDAVLTEELTEAQRRYLNAYHRRVYDALASDLSETEREWLAGCTREI